jgi:predicted PurR-regulated permease PerM
MVVDKPQGRWHFDVFLLIMAIVHIIIFVSAFFWKDGGGVWGAWLAMWLLIFGAAWVTTWEPEPQSNA